MSIEVPVSDAPNSKENRATQYLTAPETADFLGMSDEEMQEMRRERRGPPYIRLGAGGAGKILYRQEDVEAWREQQALSSAGSWEVPQ